MTEVRRCKNCNFPLHRMLKRETPKEFLRRNYCGPACRRIGRRTTMTGKRKKVDEQ